MNGNPFARRENWRHWVVAVLAAGVVATLLLVVLTKLGGQSNRPDVERAMEPPPREAPASAGTAGGNEPAAAPAPPAAAGGAPAQTAAPADGASGTIRR
jgi:hypothetical protein